MESAFYGSDLEKLAFVRIDNAGNTVDAVEIRMRRS